MRFYSVDSPSSLVLAFRAVLCGPSASLWVLALVVMGWVGRSYRTKGKQEPGSCHWGEFRVESGVLPLVRWGEMAL